MKFWRISNYADLEGIGGLKTPGRWHNRGIPVVYLAESPALALLEVLVHFDLGDSEVPENYQLLEIEYSGRKGINNLNLSALTDEWQKDYLMSRAIGDEWLSAMKGCFLKVPSALVPNSYNYLFNPRHELAVNAAITNIYHHPYDSRFMNG